MTDASTPLVEVAIPAYGDGLLLRSAVRSVLAQDSDRWMLTVVDDGPDDPALAAWFATLDDRRVSYRHNPTNLGVTANFQRCVDLATGDLVVLMGADDLMLPSYVDLVARAAAAYPDATMVMPRVRVVDATGRPVRPAGDRVKSVLAPRVDGTRELSGEPLAVSLLRGNWLYFPAVAFRREALQAHGFRPTEGAADYSVVQDLDLYLRLLLDGARLLLASDVGFAYRRHDASLSSTAESGSAARRFAEEGALFATMARTLRARGWRRAARAADAHVASRLHALLRVPHAVGARDAAQLRVLARYATALPPRQPA